MKIGSIHGRAVFLTQSGCVDINQASQGRFSALTDELIPEMDNLLAWYEKEQPAPTDSRSITDLEADLLQLDPPLTPARLL